MVFALGALGIVSVMNMIGVKVFGEMEFWFSLVKVGTLAVFLAVGAVFLASGHPVAGQMPGFTWSRITAGSSRTASCRPC